MIPGITINPNGNISTGDGTILNANEVKALIKDFQEQQQRSEQYVILGRRHTSGTLESRIHPNRATHFKIGCIEFTHDQAIGFINEYEKRTQSVMDTQVHDGMRLRGKLSDRTFIVRYTRDGVWALITENNCIVWKSCCCPRNEAPLLRDFFGSTADCTLLEILKP